MNGVRALGIAETGDREAPVGGPDLRQDDKSGEDRFTSILSRIAGSAREGAGPLDADARIAGRPASGMPDSHPRKREAGEEAPDEELAGSAANALLVAERQVRLLPVRPEANPEIPSAATEPGIELPVPPVPLPIDRTMPAPDTVIVDLHASTATGAVNGALESELAMPDAMGNEPTGRPGAGELPAFAAFGDPAVLDAAPPSTIADERPGRLAALPPVQGDRSAGEPEPGQRSPSPELPNVTVISQEKHFAPALHQDPLRLVNPEPDRAPPASPDRRSAVGPDTVAGPDGRQAGTPDGLAARDAPATPDTPAASPKRQAAGPDTPATPVKGETVLAELPPRDRRLTQTEDLPRAALEPTSKPRQAQESDVPRPIPAAIVPSSTVAAISSTEGPAMPTGGIAAADRGLAEESATRPEPLRVAAIVQEKPSAPARRFDPAGPASSEPLPEPPRSPVAEPHRVDPEATLRSIRPVPENPPSPTVPQSMPKLPERGERRQPAAGAIPAVAPSATTGSTENALAPATAAPGLGPDVLQRISGAVVEAAGSAALSAAAPETTVAVGDNPVASAPPRALTIRIDLHEHGAVHVRLQLNGNALSLRMRADSEETADQLRQDHLKLSETLSAAGYDTEIIAIEGRRSEVTPLSGGDAASSIGTDANGAANADRGAAGDNRRPTARQAQVPDQGHGEDFVAHDQEDHEPRNIAQRRADALYV